MPVSLADADVDHAGMEQLMSGYTLLHKHSLLMEAAGGNAQKLAKTVMDNVYTVSLLSVCKSLF